MGGVPKFMTDKLPAVSAGTALLGSIFLFNQPHMMMMYLKMKAAKGKLSNTNPRQQSEEVSKDATYGEQMTRAMAAHQNGLESFPPLAAGVLACVATGVDKEYAGQIAC